MPRATRSSAAGTRPSTSAPWPGWNGQSPALISARGRRRRCRLPISRACWSRSAHGARLEQAAEPDSSQAALLVKQLGQLIAGRPVPSVSASGGRESP